MMKKFISILFVAFIAVILILPLFSDASAKDGEVFKDSAIKKSNLFDMTMENKVIRIKAKEGKKLEKIMVVNEWPWIPAMQFEKYNRYFISGVSIDIND